MEMKFAGIFWGNNSERRNRESAPKQQYEYNCCLDAYGEGQDGGGYGDANDDGNGDDDADDRAFVWVRLGGDRQRRAAAAASAMG